MGVGRDPLCRPCLSLYCAPPIRRRPVPREITGGAPHLRADLGPPPPRSIEPPVADAEHDRSAGVRERSSKPGVDRSGEDVARVAPIDLDEVHAPPGDPPGVLAVVAGAAGPLGARLAAGVEVDP